MNRQIKWRQLIKNGIRVISFGRGKRYTLCYQKDLELTLMKNKGGKLLSTTTNHLKVQYNDEGGLYSIKARKRFGVSSNYLKGRLNPHTT